MYGRPLESYVQYVYNTLLNLKGENIIVTERAKLSGNTGVMHEVDVYYQFDKANVTHRVAIECKEHKRPIELGHVQKFFSTLTELNNVIGVMVSKSGYQSGAKKFAEAKGILLLTTDELPNILDLMASQIKKLFIPDNNDIGEPFWVLMECRNDKINGDYYAHSINHKVYEKTIPLFWSKINALEFMNVINADNEKLAIMGLRQYHLKTLLKLTQIHNKVCFSIMPFATIASSDIPISLLSSSNVEEEFLHIWHSLA